MTSLERVAFVAPRFPEGATVGGAETLLKQLAWHLADSVREVDFLTTCATNHHTWQNELPPGMRRHGPLRVHYFPVDERPDPARFFRIQDRISAGARVTAAEERSWLEGNVSSRALCEHLAADRTRYDRIVVGPYLFGLSYRVALADRSRTVLVPCLHDEPFAKLAAFRELFGTVRTILFNSAPEERLARRLFELDAVHTAVVGMGMDPFAVTPGAFHRRHALNAPYLLYCGRREPLKGTPLLLRYLAIYRARTGQDVKLVLTGTGDVTPPPELAPHVLDLGFVTDDEKHAAMADALAFCHPSTNESFGIVLLESWLAGRPALVHAGSIVLTDHCRRCGGGLWFRHYAEFEAALDMLLSRPDTAAAMGRQGRRYVTERYGWDTVAAKLRAALAV